MGFFDNVDQYFSSPDVSTGYSGMDSSGGDYWSQGFSVPESNSFDFGSLADTFWDTSDTWDTSYDALFSTQPDFNMNGIWAADEYMSNMNDGSSWYDKTKDFLGSKSGLSLIGGLLGGAGRYLSADKAASSARDARDYNAAQAEAERAWREQQEALQREHDERMLEMKLAAEAENRPGPGGASNTSSNLDKNKVDWSKKR